MKVEGAAQLRVLAVELKAAGNVELKRSMARNLRRATLPARKAVKAEELAVLPKRGGLNEWVASTPVGHRTVTGPRSAGVRIVQSKKGHGGAHDLRRADDTGVIRHPNRGGPGWSADRRKKPDGWSETHIPTGWFERPLLAMAPQVTAAMQVVLDDTARAAGFR